MMAAEGSATEAREALQKAGDALKEAAGSLESGNTAGSAEALRQAGESLQQAMTDASSLPGGDDTPPYGTGSDDGKDGD